METCILIPKELCFVLTLNSDPRNILEMDVTIWSRCSIPSGFVFYPDDGRVHHDNIDVFTSIDRDNIRHRYGCYEEVLEIDGQKVRHCNWIRFLKSSNDPTKVNIVAMKFKGQTMYQTIRPLDPNEEMVVYFDDGDDHIEAVAEPNDVSENISQNESSQNTENAIDDNAEDIDVCGYSSRSTSPSSPSSNTLSSPRSLSPDRKLYSSSLLSEVSPPSAFHLTALNECSSLREEECHSGMSDSTSISEEGSPVTMERSDRESAFRFSPVNHSVENRHSSPVLSDRIPVSRNRSKTWLACEYCGKKFDRPSLLKRHERTHTGEKPHVCDICSKGFSTSSSLNTHRRIHSGEKPHECKICGKRFTASSNLYYHRMTHTKDKPHKCTMCSKSFPTPGDLRSHMYVHSGTWPFTCTVCHRGFSKQTNLKNHMLMHDGKRSDSAELDGGETPDKTAKRENDFNKQLSFSSGGDIQLPHQERVEHSSVERVERDNSLSNIYPGVSKYNLSGGHKWTQPMFFSSSSVPREHFQPMPITFPGQHFHAPMLQIYN